MSHVGRGLPRPRGGRAIGRVGLTLFAGVIATFALYLGIVMIVAITTDDEKRREVCYRIFHDLVEFFREALFRRRGRQ